MVLSTVLRWLWCAEAATFRYGHLTVPQVLAQIHQESGGNPKAVSSTGAQGLMQIEPATAAELGLTDPWDPLANVMAGVRYMVWLMEQFASWDIALAAYYAGPGTISEYKTRVLTNFPQEVQSYVANVRSLTSQYSSWLDNSRNLPSLAFGNNGEAVRLLQQLMGMPTAQQDGVYGTQTLDAVLAAKRKAGLPENGLVGDGLWSYLLYLHSSNAS
jgi:hypothetical protein